MSIPKMKILTIGDQDFEVHDEAAHERLDELNDVPYITFEDESEIELPQQTINDAETATDSTWSSSKIAGELNKVQPDIHALRRLYEKNTATPIPANTTVTFISGKLPANNTDYDITYRVFFQFEVAIGSENRGYAYSLKWKPDDTFIVLPLVWRTTYGTRAEYNTYEYLLTSEAGSGEIDFECSVWVSAGGDGGLVHQKCIVEPVYWEIPESE